MGSVCPSFLLTLLLAYKIFHSNGSKTDLCLSRHLLDVKVEFDVCCMLPSVCQSKGTKGKRTERICPIKAGANEFKGWSNPKICNMW